MNVTFSIASNEGVGPIRFGMSPDTVRGAIGSEYESFRRTPQSVHPCDYFPNIHCFVYYNLDGKAEAIEFSEPAVLLLDDNNLLGMGFADLVELLTAQDGNLLIEVDGFTSKKLGIGCYAPSAEDNPGGYAESIIVFASGYYD